jgi:hypothetical protein
MPPAISQITVERSDDLSNKEAIFYAIISPYQYRDVPREVITVSWMMNL